ncbi:AMP-binding protein [Gordonia sp. (in: high G+C Gram-positive bacteria)]|jgi:long-chain acyl-CoA synthetase|uniref:AMP-binding protein n=1 Tax=Gordonia sp. (in: high G+C Gram-positive bacteria) TaxID=84139 RepID=UPI001D22BA7C|nr:AMP-binding protein [Gordonia sp. (in: high G+C Gram-positive bacteria)]MCB1297214.1 AMP-binding protein [Gordonia sp. (in: high G+C Gram-positive bacteria)]HMS73784.1 AMP-binding protein [Gordonia sp. (in: high G+C Gram-positive bacteria)]HQV16931.1 AMP-binding protein [Gordonia sp. (in: high G+C Gram-positive bacteria)]
MPSLSDAINKHAAERPDNIALRGSGTEFTYKQAADAILAYAGMLREKGVEADDRVLYIAPTVPEFAIAYFGINACGAVVLPANPLCTPTELAYYIEDAGCKLVIAWDGISEAARTAAETAGIEFVALESGAAATSGTPIDAPVDREIDDIACILYTSGTTGRPKGAELTVGNLKSAAGISGRLGEYTDADAVGTALPLFHVFGQASVMLAAMEAGAPLSLMARFHPKDFIDMIVNDGLTAVGGVPTMWNAMLHVPGDVEPGAFDKLRLAVSGGASLPLEVMQAFKRRFGCAILEGYGLTETCGLATFSRPGIAAPQGTVGLAVYDSELEVRDGEGNSVPVGERGEVFVKGPFVMRGYWKRPDATAETLIDGWLKTGDIGELDTEGNLRIVDRAKDLIIRGGYNVYPSEIEETLYAHPGIVEAAVVGVPDAHYGEEVVAVVAPKPDSELTAEEVTAWCTERLAAYKYPRAVVFVDELPKGPSGKILKRAIDRDPLIAAVDEYRAAKAAARG